MRGFLHHGLEKPFPNKTILTIDFAGKMPGREIHRQRDRRPFVRTAANWQADSDSTLGYCFIPPARMA